MIDPPLQAVQDKINSLSTKAHIMGTCIIRTNTTIIGTIGTTTIGTIRIGLPRTVTTRTVTTRTVIKSVITRTSATRDRPRCDVNELLLGSWYQDKVIDVTTISSYLMLAWSLACPFRSCICYVVALIGLVYLEGLPGENCAVKHSNIQVPGYI